VRILTVGNMFPPHHLGGYELMWHSAVHALLGAGHRVRVLTTDFVAENPDRSVPEGEDVHRELRWYWRDHAWPRRSLRERLAIERHNLATLRRHLEELRPDVVAWWAMGGMSMSLIEAVRRRGTPAVGFVQDDWMVYGPRVDAWQRVGARMGPLRGVAERALGPPFRVRLDRAATWVFVSRTVRARAVAAGYDVADAAIEPSGIDPALYPAAPAPSEWGWNLLCVGRIDRRKGIHVAIRALADLHEASLDVVGSGDRRHLMELEQLARDVGAAERVRFRARPRAELVEDYARADAVLFPVQWEEPWGLVPLEAMAVGRPVIATGTGGSGEYLRDGVNCLIFKPRDDPSALAAAVRRLAEDEDLCDRVRAEGFATAARFTERAFNDAVLEIVEAAAR
jgi:glycogen(starch) synthase